MANHDWLLKEGYVRKKVLLIMLIKLKIFNIIDLYVKKMKKI